MAVKKVTSILPGFSIALVPAKFKAAENDQRFIARAVKNLGGKCLKSQ